MSRSSALPALLLTALLAVGCTAAHGDSQGADPTEPSLSSIATPPPPATRTPSRTPRATSRVAPRVSAPSPTPRPSARPTQQPKPSATPRPSTATATHPDAAAGQVVVLDPGHNGANGSHPEIINQQVPAGGGVTKPCNTTGTATNAGYPEHAFNWDVALRVRAILRSHGITVLMTRPDDTGVGPCVNKRAEIGNDAHAAAVVSIHGDGSLTGHGFHIIRAARDAGTAATDAGSARLAADVHQPMVAESGITTSTYAGSNGYDSRSDLAGLTLSDRPTIMIECGNMRNSGDAAIMSSAAGRAGIATAISAGISTYLAGS